MTWDGAPTFAKGMFVALVKGHSMEPVIPNGAYCLFRLVPLPSSPERAVLVRYSGDPDPETGGQYTVKRYKEARNAKGDRHIVLLPVNPDFSPLVLDRGTAPTSASSPSWCTSSDREQSPSASVECCQRAVLSHSFEYNPKVA